MNSIFKFDKFNRFFLIIFKYLLAIFNFNYEIYWEYLLFEKINMVINIIIKMIMKVIMI